VIATAATSHQTNFMMNATISKDEQELPKKWMAHGQA
jgi:hypothetical protein